MRTIPIVVSEHEESSEETKGFFTPDADTIIDHISVETLSENLNSVCGGVCEALDNLKAVGDFSLKEVSIQVEVSAQGGVSLIGTANVGGKGAITLKFEK